jgi:hypothetical protein
LNFQSAFINNIKRYFLIDELNRERAYNTNKFGYNRNNLYNSWILQRILFGWRLRWNSFINPFHRSFKHQSGYCKKNYGIYRPGLQQKKAIDERYNVLNDSIFIPLSTIIITPSDSESEGIPYLIFDPSEVRKTEPNHFEEAKKHFKKIKILKRFEDLEQSVNTFNKKLDAENKEITKIVSKYFKDKGFDTSYNPSEIPKKKYSISKSPFTRFKIILESQDV